MATGLHSDCCKMALCDRRIIPLCCMVPLSAFFCTADPVVNSTGPSSLRSRHAPLVQLQLPCAESAGPGTLLRRVEPCQRRSGAQRGVESSQRCCGQSIQLPRARSPRSSHGITAIRQQQRKRSARRARQGEKQSSAAVLYTRRAPTPSHGDGLLDGHSWTRVQCHGIDTVASRCVWTAACNNGRCVTAPSD